MSVLWSHGALLHFSGTSLLFDMQQFEDLFTDDKIISYLCKVRAKIARQRNKKHLLHILTNDRKFNYHTIPEGKQSKYEKDLLHLLNSMLPPRKKWKKLGEKSRVKDGNGKDQKISTIEKNQYSLLKTVKYYRSKSSEEPFILRLNSFILEIQDAVRDSNYEISTPAIYPKPKDRKKLHQLKPGEANICRPLSLFSLKDRIILSFTNNYLTRLFDKYFDNFSFAFRAIRHQVVNHHTAIQKIIEYKRKHKQTSLWIAECDMKKFFDSVNHKLIAQQFEVLLELVRRERPHLSLDACTRIFKSYLNCYSFNHNVLPKNSDSEYWNEYKIPKGQYGWIEDEIVHHNFYENISNERIGIPQGGALSGLIANIVLDIADKIVRKNCENLFYTRFCDDMIIMHPDKDICEENIQLYKDTLKKIKLIPHEFSLNLVEERKGRKKYLPDKTLKPFWKEKSKGPYKWDSVANGGFPWVGFVGYEMHYSGAIRIRKTSLTKELKKQKEVVENIKKATENLQRASKGTITESAIKRLIGMSVSRVELWNCATITHEMCWKNGFQELNSNRYSVRQIKRLDKGRNKVYYDLVKKCSDPVVPKDRKEENSLERLQIISYNKPFSYYYHLIERAKAPGSEKSEGDATSDIS